MRPETRIAEFWDRLRQQPTDSWAWRQLADAYADAALAPQQAYASRQLRRLRPDWTPGETTEARASEARAAEDLLLRPTTPAARPWASARIDRSDFRDAWLQGSSFVGARVQRSQFRNTDLRGADLRIAGGPSAWHQAFRGARINTRPITVNGDNLLQLGDSQGRRLPPTHLPQGESPASMGLVVDNTGPLVPKRGPDADGSGEERRAFSYTVDRAQDCRTVQEDQRARPEVAEVFR